MKQRTRAPPLMGDAFMVDLIPVSEPDLSGNELKYVTDCVTSGWVSSTGKYVTAFEEAFAGWCGAQEGVATMNGTAALHLALHALGIGPGDEVIVPTFTFVASANAVKYTGATPIFADSEYATWNVDPSDIARRISPRTRAIMAVHLFGHPARMDEITLIADRHGLVVVEDAAESHGAECRGRRVGSIGHAAAFSFYGNKLLTTGQGGMVVTKDAALAQRMRVLRDHGMSRDRQYWHEELGFNYRMTNLQAALGLAQWERADRMLSRKREIAESYRHLLHDVPGLTMPPEQPWALNAYWLFTILVDQSEFGVSRDELVDRLMSEGIETRRVFHPMHTMPLYRSAERYPVAEDLAARGLNLPSSVRLTQDDIERVARSIRKAGLRATVSAPAGKM